MPSSLILPGVFGNASEGVIPVVLEADFKYVMRSLISVGGSGNVSKISVFCDGQGPGSGQGLLRPVIYNPLSGGLVGIGDELEVESGAGQRWLHMAFSDMPGGVALIDGVWDYGVMVGGSSHTIRLYGDTPDLAVVSIRNPNVYVSGPTQPFGGGLENVAVDLNIYCSFFAAPQDEADPLLPFPDAQRGLLAGAGPLPDPMVTNVGWYGTRVDDERGSFAVVRTGGPLQDLVGQRLRLTVRGTVRPRSVIVFVKSEADLIEDICVSRRAFIALQLPSQVSAPVLLELMQPNAAALVTATGEAVSTVPPVPFPVSRYQAAATDVGVTFWDGAIRDVDVADGGFFFRDAIDRAVRVFGDSAARLGATTQRTTTDTGVFALPDTAVGVRRKIRAITDQGVTFASSISMSRRGKGVGLFDTGVSPGESLASTKTTTGSVPAVSHVTEGVAAGAATTASIVPAANALLLLTIVQVLDGADPGDPVPAGGGLPGWAKVAGTVVQNNLAARVRTTIFRGMSPTPGSGPITWAASAGTRSCWSVEQFLNVDQTGINGSGACRQSGVNTSPTGPLTVTLATLNDAQSIVFGAIGGTRGISSTITFTPGSGFTALSNQSPAFTYPNPALLTEWKLNDTTVDAAVDAPAYLAGAAIEIVKVAVVTPPPTGQSFPMWGHKWGGNESAAATVVKLLYSKSGQCNPTAARATNPGLVALVGGGLDPLNGDWTQRHMFEATYGGGIMSWPGGGGVRAYQASDDSGMKLQDPSEQGVNFALHKNPTADWLASAYNRSWDLEGSIRGFNGFHSDNLFPGSRLSQFFRAPLTTDPATWDAGMVRMINAILAHMGAGKGFGGNTCYLTDNPTVRQATQYTEVEDLETWIGSPSLFASRGALLFAWQADGPQPKYTLVGHSVAQSNTSGLRLGLACACILGGCYGPGDSDDDLYFPAGFTQGEFGKPLGPATQSGNTWTRVFEHKTVIANLDSKVGTFV